MENIKDNDPSYSPGEAFEISDRPGCSNCCDSGTFYDDEGNRDFCDCEAGMEAQDAAVRDMNDDDWTDVEADADTLASAGYGTDEDYGYFGGEDY